MDARGTGDRLEITEVLQRYFYALDKTAYVRLRTYLSTSDATLSYEMGGGPASSMSLSNMIEVFRHERVRTFDRSAWLQRG